MYARTVSASVPVDKVDEAVRLWREAVGPSAPQQKGNRGARLLVNRQSGKVLSMGLWETEADLEASVKWNQEQVARFANKLLAPPVIDHYEVAVEA